MTDRKTIIARAIKPTAKERILAKIHIEESGCWAWTGRTVHDGYGRIRINSGEKYAHRIAYEAFVGPIPEGLLVCHHCDNPPCCNPDHLFVGTQADNVNDMNRKGRGNPPHGEGHRWVKLTEKEVRGIYSQRQPPRNASGLASKFGVTDGTIQMIWRGKTWKRLIAKINEEESMLEGEEG